MTDREALKELKKRLEEVDKQFPLDKQELTYEEQGTLALLQSTFPHDKNYRSLITTVTMAYSALIFEAFEKDPHDGRVLEFCKDITMICVAVTKRIHPERSFEIKVTGPDGEEVIDSWK